jgi:arylformamidase
MQFVVHHQKHTYTCDASKPIDISIPMQSGVKNPNAFGIQHPVFEPFKSGSFVASVSEGGSVNCENLLLNPHGNGTHTECVGHITPNRITIHDSLKQFLFVARVVSATPHQGVIIAQDVIPHLSDQEQALIIRTLPNTSQKLTRNYSSIPTPYLQPELCRLLADHQIKHLLVDLPSVDPEVDEGKLTAHRMFWSYPQSPRLDATITEMIFVPDEIQDGLYILNLQIASLHTDASPSKPILYKPITRND